MQVRLNSGSYASPSPSKASKKSGLRTPKRAGGRTSGTSTPRRTGGSRTGSRAGSKTNTPRSVNRSSSSYALSPRPERDPNALPLKFVKLQNSKLQDQLNALQKQHEDLLAHFKVQQKTIQDLQRAQGLPVTSDTIAATEGQTEKSSQQGEATETEAKASSLSVQGEQEKQGETTSEVSKDEAGNVSSNSPAKSSEKEHFVEKEEPAVDEETL